MFTQAGFEAAFSYWRLFLEGTVTTVVLSACAVFFGFIMALILALCRMSKVGAAALDSHRIRRGISCHPDARAGAAHLQYDDHGV